MDFAHVLSFSIALVMHLYVTWSDECKSGSRLLNKIIPKKNKKDCSEINSVVNAPGVLIASVAYTVVLSRIYRYTLTLETIATVLRTTPICRLIFYNSSKLGCAAFIYRGIPIVLGVNTSLSALNQQHVHVVFHSCSASERPALRAGLISIPE